jgi:CHAD domain-containing protein
MNVTASIAAVPEKKSGLLYWAQRAIEECDKASVDFAADPVHDLRVAIRRCRFPQ